MPDGKKNQEPVALHATKGKARETILDQDVNEINSESAVENIINCLDNLFLKA